LIATQIKYLQRAQSKLPDYYNARCIIPDLAFEQSSSQVVAATKRHTGGIAIDLTCGLGVDSLSLSRRFQKVISIERNPVLARLAKENFKRLGVSNIEVVCADATEYISNYTDRVDLIYADPDRRSTDGRKLVLLEECSPNILAMRNRLEEIAPRIVIKLSPMFDTTEALRQFAPCCIEAISDGGECKELVVEFGQAVTTNEFRATIADSTSQVITPQGLMRYGNFTPEQYRYLILSDVALRKIGLAVDYLADKVDFVASPTGYAFSANAFANDLCRVLEIESIEPYSPKELKRNLKTEGVKRIDILKRDFRIAAADIARALGVNEGGKRAIAFTEIDGQMWQIKLK
jgi:predicted RNA methylase